MTSTAQHLTGQRVADDQRAEAKAWLVRRLAWERCLRELEAPGPAEPVGEPELGRKLGGAGHLDLPVALAS
jgi:hypothetical protein